METTNGELLEVINKGFQGVQDQLNTMNLRLTNVEGRLTNVEGRLTNVEGRLTGVEGKVDGLDRQLTKLNGRFNTMVNVLEKKKVINVEDKRLIHM